MGNNYALNFVVLVILYIYKYKYIYIKIIYVVILCYQSELLTYEANLAS